MIRRKERRLGRKTALDARRSYAASRGIPFDPMVDRQQLVLPAVMSFCDNHEETAALFADLREIALRRGRAVMLHFTRLERIDPDAALVLVAEIFRIRNLRSRAAVTGTYPLRRAVYELLRDMGFFNLLKIEELRSIPPAEPAPGRPVYLHFLTGNRVEPEVIDKFVTIVEQYIIPMSDLARARLVAALGSGPIDVSVAI